MEKYGPLATVVLYSSNLVAAAWAIRTVALGKAESKGFSACASADIGCDSSHFGRDRLCHLPEKP
jgi:hypothetical protein